MLEQPGNNKYDPIPSTTLMYINLCISNRLLHLFNKTLDFLNGTMVGLNLEFDYL
jgi:hypothetical protein